MDIYSVANQMKMERKTIFDLKMRVTFYARVSTTREEQENSIENQITFFKEMIKKNPNWKYVEGYVDRVRGESAENRANFMLMVEDGKAGKFDLILTKEREKRIFFKNKTHNPCIFLPLKVEGSFYIRVSRKKMKGLMLCQF